MKKIILSVLLGTTGNLMIAQEQNLKECKSEENRRECVEKKYFFNHEMREKKFDSNGELEWIRYYTGDNKPLLEGHYKNEKREGVWREYDYESGNLVIEMYYKNGKRDGITKYYYTNGKLQSEISYKEGKLNGIARQYDKNGNLRGEKIYINGIREGFAQQYHTSKK